MPDGEGVMYPSLVAPNSRRFPTRRDHDAHDELSVVAELDRKAETQEKQKYIFEAAPVGNHESGGDGKPQLPRLFAQMAALVGP